MCKLRSSFAPITNVGQSLVLIIADHSAGINLDFSCLVRMPGYGDLTHDWACAIDDVVKALLLWLLTCQVKEGQNLAILIGPQRRNLTSQQVSCAMDEVWCQHRMNLWSNPMSVEIPCTFSYMPSHSVLLLLGLESLPDVLSLEFAKTLSNASLLNQELVANGHPYLQSYSQAIPSLLISV